MTIRVQDESGKVDLNAAPAPLLVRLLISAGLDPDTAQIETDRILDWREAGELRRLNGAKSADYRDAGLPYGPRLGSFPDVEELKLVMGITPEMFSQLQPALTIYSQQQDVRPSVAPREALLALSGVDADAVDQALAARQVAARGVDQGYHPAQADVSGRAFTISATITQERQTMMRTAVIRISGELQTPVWIYNWD